MDKSKLKKYIPYIKKRADNLGIQYQSISISPLKNKKYRIILIDGTIIDFGHPEYSDYLQHHDESRRKRFWQRWGNNNLINDKLSPIFYSTRLLW